uniref:Diphthamide biosynthesis protein 3 n=1 Tax=Tetranychus urticae TaxID=32264 RepID=T1KJK9_TETUR
MSDTEEPEVHDEVEIEDFTYDAEEEKFTYPCPCGDLFVITKEDLENGEEIARCPTCSLIVRVIYDFSDITKYFQSAQTQTALELVTK